MGWLPPIMLLNLLALAAYVYVAVLVVVRNRRSLLNWSCAAVLVALAIWSIEDVVHGNPDASYASVKAFGNLGVLGWCTFGSLNLLFSLVLTRQRRALRSWVTYVLLAVVPLALIVVHWRGGLVASYAPTWFGWSTVWTRTAWPGVFYLYYLSTSLLSLLLIQHFARQSPRARERERAWLIFGTGLIAVVLGTITDVVLPMTTRGNRFPEIANLITLVWAWGLYRAVIHYGLMSVTVQAAADDILAAMADSVLLLSPGSKVVTCNQSFLDAVGRPRPDVIGADAGDFFAVPEELGRTLAAVEREGSVTSVELDLAGGQRQVPVSISGRMMRETGGDALGIVLVLHDVTGRRAAQAELVKHERLAALGQVAGSLAHELRNPLAVIRNAAYFLRLTVADKLEGRPARHLELIEEEIERSTAIITSLLDFARGRPCEPVPVDSAELLRRAALQARLPDSVRLDFRLPDGVIVQADPVQIEQALVNLLTNARQAMPQGGLVTLEAARRGDHVVFRLSDTGNGVKPEDLPRLFEPLFSTKTFGVGLGLAVTKSFIEANGGTISVESEAGKGTTFTFSLPAA